MKSSVLPLAGLAAGVYAAKNCTVTRLTELLPKNATVYYAKNYPAHYNFTPPTSLNYGATSSPMGISAYELPSQHALRKRISPCSTIPSIVLVSFCLTIGTAGSSPTVMVNSPVLSAGTPLSRLLGTASLSFRLISATRETTVVSDTIMSRLSRTGVILHSRSRRQGCD